MLHKNSNNYHWWCFSYRFDSWMWFGTETYSPVTITVMICPIQILYTIAATYPIPATVLWRQIFLLEAMLISCSDTRERFLISYSDTSEPFFILLFGYMLSFLFSIRILVNGVLSYSNTRERFLICISYSDTRDQFLICISYSDTFERFLILLFGYTLTFFISDSDTCERYLVFISDSDTPEWSCCVCNGSIYIIEYIYLKYWKEVKFIFLLFKKNIYSKMLPRVSILSIIYTIIYTKGHKNNHLCCNSCSIKWCLVDSFGYFDATLAGITSKQLHADENRVVFEVVYMHEVVSKLFTYMKLLTNMKLFT